MQVQIVYLGSLPKAEYSPSSHHFSMLQEVVESRLYFKSFFSLFYWYPAVILFSLSVLSSSVENSLIRSYKRSFNGFAANLTANERQKLASEYSYINYCLQHPKEKLIYSDCSNDKSISFEL